MMASSKNIYIGIYFKVYMPKEKFVSGRICPKCEKFLSTKFCPNDGVATIEIERERMQWLGSPCEEIFGNEDQLTTANLSNDDFEIVIANLSTQPGHLRLEDESVQSLPEEDYSGDWTILADALDARGIKYEKGFGIVTYWN